MERPRRHRWGRSTVRVDDAHVPVEVVFLAIGGQALDDGDVARFVRGEQQTTTGHGENLDFMGECEIA